MSGINNHIRINLSVAWMAILWNIVLLNLEKHTSAVTHIHYCRYPERMINVIQMECNVALRSFQDT